jgi:hypothetical protein
MADYNSLAKPGTVSDVFLIPIDGSNGIGNDDAAATKIRIKAETFAIAFAVQVVETTGDGDSIATYDHGAMLRARIQLGGYAYSENVIGLTNMQVSSTYNSSGVVTAAANGDYLMEVKYHGSTRAIRGRLMIESASMNFSKKSPLVALQLTGYLALALDQTDADHVLEKAN